VRSVLAALLRGSCARAPLESLDAWWARHVEVSCEHELPIDRAILGGFAADRVGYAFASGYREALVALLPSVAEAASGVTILSATEAGGVKPSAIQTVIADRGGALSLSGEKKWATLATRADFILVAAVQGRDERDRPRLRMVRIPASREGVAIRPMPPPSFTPEIPHAEITLREVAITADEILPGDGWDDYLKPFRTVEDVHVHAALAGYTVGAARRAALPRELVEEAITLVVSTRAIAAEDPRALETHVGLAGVLDAAKRFVARLEDAWPAGSEERARWDRDRPLLQVASSARGLRAEAAWRALGG
jgi:acyl-CoA dehydrogenase